eukprot:scaffold296291_cov31-Tisochrysis_lutea.AAC.3
MSHKATDHAPISWRQVSTETRALCSAIVDNCRMETDVIGGFYRRSRERTGAATGHRPNADVVCLSLQVVGGIVLRHEQAGASCA